MSVSIRSLRLSGGNFQNKLENLGSDLAGDHVAAIRASFQAAKDAPATGGTLAPQLHGFGLAGAAGGQDDGGGLSMAYGGGLSFASSEQLATMGVSSWEASKLQAGLAELFVEAQLQAQGLNGAARASALAQFTSDNSMAILSAGYLAIDAVAANGNGAALLAQLQTLGLQGGASFGAMAGGFIPLDAIDDLAGLGLLAFARPVYAATNVGAVTSQNDAQMLTDDLRTTFGVDGSGITIGVLSDSFNTRVAPLTTYAQDVTSGDLPAGVSILEDGPAGRSDEGRAMAQLIYDIAPGASLAFHTAFSDMANFASGIVELAQAGADIIVDDVRYFTEPFFQDGILATAVNTAYDMGAMYFSSAGNYGVRSYESVFRNSGQTFVNGATTYVLHDFDPGAGVDTAQTVTQNAPASGNPVNYILQWDQPFFSVDPASGGSVNDLALIFRTTGGALLGVIDGANIGGDPIELGGFNGSGTLTVAIGVRAGVDPGIVKYVTIGGNSFTVNEFATNSGTSYGHSNAEHAIAVGAADWIDSPEFGQTPPLSENFSSLGGVPILFDPDGTRLGAPVIRDHVEFTAGDGGNTTFFSSDRGDDADAFPNFFGTSAAAPNAAAMAALLMELFPTATRDQIELAMKASAIDIQNDWAGGVVGAGNDRTTGTGLIQGPAAVAALQAILAAQPNGTGAIAIIGYNTGQTDGTGNPPTVESLRFVALDALAAGTVIYFTDRSWNGTNFTAGGSDGTATYTVGGGGLAAGATVELTGAALGTLNLEETAGDTIYAYHGTNVDTPTQFLFAAEIGDGGNVFNGSLVNTGLVNGVTAVAVGLDSASYQGPTTEAGAIRFNGESLLENIADFGNWVGDDRDGQNALNQPDHIGPYGVSPDVSLWAGGSGGGNGIFNSNVDGSVDSGNTGYNLNQLYTNLLSSGNNVFWGIKDIVFDTVHGKFFVADSDITGGHNRVLQGNIADLLGNPGSVPTLTTLYSDTGTTTASRIFNLEVDKANGIVYFDHGQTLMKVVYDTANQAGVTLATLGGAGSGNPTGTTNSGFVDDFAIDFATGTLYFSVHRVVAAQDGDVVSRNFIGRITGVDPGDGAGAFSWGGGQITLLPFSPDDDDAGVLFNSGEQFPQELGTVEGIALSPNGQTLYIVTAKTLYDHDGDGGFAGDGNPATTDPILTPGGIYAYALTGNAAGAYTIVYQPTDDGNDGSAAINLANGPQGLLDDIEVDPVTGRLYFLDTTGDQLSPVSNPPGDEGIWAINPDGSNVRFVQALSNVNALGATSLFLNRAPTVTSSTQATPTTAETAGAGSGSSNPVQPFVSLDVTDAENASLSDQLSGAVVRISDGFLSGAGHQDQLTINGTLTGTLDFGSQDITYSYNNATGVMVLSGVSTFNNYEAAIMLVRYSVSGDNPTDYGNEPTRTIAWSVSDGLSHSDEVSTTVTVSATNDNPVNVIPASESGTEDVATYINGLSVSDVDADPTGQNLTVTLTVTDGTLTVNGAVPGGLTAADITNNGTDSVTLTGTAAELNATFANATAVQFSLGANGNGTADLTMVVSDNGNTGTGGALGDSDTFTITIAAVNDAPTVAGDGTEEVTAIFEDQPSAVGQTVSSLFAGQFSDALDNQTVFPGGSTANSFIGVAVVDNDATAGTGNWEFFNGATWTVIPTSASLASATLLNGTTAIRFSPAPDYNGPMPLLTVRLIDSSGGASVTSGDTADLSGAGSGGTTRYSGTGVTLGGTVNPVNDAPTSTALNGDAATYVEGSVQAFLDVGGNATIGDIDSLNFSTGTLTVAITGGLAAAEDQLLIDTAGTVTVAAGVVSVGGIGIATVSGGGAGGAPLVFTFDEDATPARVQELIRAISYTNSDAVSPTEGIRTISWTLVDGDGTANGGADTLSVTSTVEVLAINTPPDGTDNTVTIDEDGAHIFAAVDFGFSDPSEGDAFAGVVLTTPPAAGDLYLNGVAITVAGTFVSATDIGNGLLTYQPDPNGNGAAYASFTFQVRDDGGNANGGSDTDATPNTMTIDVDSVNDAPTSTNLDGDAATYTEGAAIALLDVGSDATLADVDSTDFGGGSLRISISAGLVAAEDRLIFDSSQITLSNGYNAGSIVTVGIFDIGTIRAGGSGQNGEDLIIDFNLAAPTPFFVDQFLSMIGYTNTDLTGPTGGIRTISWTLVDGDGTANGGVDTLSLTSTVEVISINTEPQGAENTITLLEDGSHTFADTEFGFNDAADGDNFAGVVLTTLPAAGDLYLNGVAITVAGTFVSAADIIGGLLTYEPDPDGNGASYSSFTFQVRDDGGVANGGVDTDQTPATMTIDVTAVNDAPTGTSLDGDAATWTEGNAPVVLDLGGNATIADVDSLDFSTGTLTVAITAGGVPAQDRLGIDTSGTVTAAGNALSVGGVQIATFTGGTNGNPLVFTLDPDATPATVQALVRAITYTNTGGLNPTEGTRTITWTLVDGDGTTNSGADTLTQTTTLDVQAINDSPTGTDATWVINEDSTYTFSEASFGFSDINSDDFAGVVITTVPVPGTLFYDADGVGGAPAVAVTAGQFISAADIALGLLYLEPPTNANGTPYTSFTFQVRDDGGTINGGLDTDLSANTLTFDVTAVNDAPVNGVPGPVTINEDQSFTLSSPNGNMISVDDVDASTLTVTLSVAHGTLTIASTLGLSFSGGSDGTNDATMTFSGSALAINTALAAGLTYNPTANYNGADAISVTTTDGGQTGTGGTGTDSDSIGITLNPVNDAPSGADNTVSGSEDDEYPFTAADFGFSDPVEGNTLLAVQITTLPGAGQLLLNGVAVNAGDFIPIASINGGLLTFAPAANQFGDNYASFTFQVQDNGGTANGGVDVDPTQNTITIDIEPDNLPPVVDLNGAGGGVNFTTTFTEDGAAVGIGAGILVSDPDSGLGDLIVGATVTLTDKVAGDSLVLSTPLPLGFSAIITDNAGDITIEISGTGTGAQYQSILSSIRYSTTSQDPTVGGTDLARTVAVTVDDGSVDSAVATATINITAVDDLPVAQPDIFTITESGTIAGGNLFASNGSGADADPDGPPLAISAVNGSGGNVGTQITLASGALLTVNANGTFDYNPNGFFLPTPTPGSGSSNTPGHDSFTYTLAGGNTVTVNITLTGLDTNDTLLGTIGADILSGGNGNDTYHVENGSDQVLEAAGQGNDRVVAATTFALASGSSVETLEAQSGNAAIDLFGNELGNTLIGNAGDNVLNGGAGVDTTNGGAGNDWHFVDNAGDVVVDGAGQGNDRVFAAVSYTLGAGAEVELISTTFHAGTTAINLTGNAFVNIVYGNDGANILNGAGGADTMVGRLGSDFFYVDDAGDRVVENVGEGTDRVLASVSYTLGAGVSVEVMSTTSHVGTTAINLTGNELAQAITGNDGANVLDGKAGADTMVGRLGDDWYYVDNAGDQVVEAVGEGNDRVLASVSYTLAAGVSAELFATILDTGTAAINLTGNDLVQTITGNDGANVINGAGGDDTINGRAGDDVLHGGTGIDELHGNLGNDWFFVDAGDHVHELVGEGNDRVFTSASYTLAAGAEIEILSTTNDGGTAAINLTGNEFNNTIYGNAGANVLNGAGGADILIGRQGDDQYYVDSASDQVVEALAQGNDRVFTAVSYTLAAGASVEIMSTTLHSGTTAINLTGNEQAQAIYGNAGDNVITGGGGADSLIGFGGNDTFMVSNAATSIAEGAGEGNDRVFASVSYALGAAAQVEILSTNNNAGTGAINLTGNGFANTITGNAGANILDGKGGDDSLVGLAGADTFAFTTALGAGNVDVVFGFEHGIDKIAVDNAVFTQIGGLGALNANAFHVGTGAHDGDDRIIYNNLTGQLYYDADGNGAGAAIQFATLSPGLTLTASDFIVI